MTILVILLSYLGAFFCYATGVALNASVDILMLRRKHPDEAKEINILSTYWVQEWPSFLVSTIFCAIYLLCFSIFFGVSIKLFGHDIPFLIWYKPVSILLGIGSQFAAIRSVGVSKSLIKQVADKIVSEKEEGGK